MKKIFSILLIANCLLPNCFSQAVKISDLPAISGSPANLWLPAAEAGSTKKVSGAQLVADRLAITDTTGKWITDIIRTPGVDSFWYRKGGVLYGVKDSTGGGSSGWGFLGDAITAGQFIGTTNTEPFVAKANSKQRMSLGDSAWIIGNERAYIKSNNVGNKLHIYTPETTSDTSTYKLLVGKPGDGENAYMSSYPVVNDASKADTIQTYGYMVDTVLNHSISGGDNNFYTSWAAYGNVSAALNYKEIIEFTLTTKPTASTEGIWLGRLSANSFARSSIVARAVYVDATHWTINLYWVIGFTTAGEALVASTPIYTPASIAMTNGANYRIEISFNSPNVQVDFSRIDTTLSYEKSVIEKTSIPYTYTTVIGNNAQIPNTGYWSYGTIGSSPAGVYAVHKMQVLLNSQINTDFAVVGNSIATGYNSSTPENTWTNRIFENTGRSYSVFAGPSDRTDEVLARLDEIWVTNPKYVLLEIGWNDIGASSGSATFSANLTKIIDSIQAHNIVPIVLKLPQTAFGYDTAFVNVCSREDVKLIDVGNTLIGSMDIYDIHPNDRGNMIIANLVRLRCPEIFGSPNPVLLDNNENSLSRTVTGNTAADFNTNKYYIDATTGNVTLTLYGADVATVGKIITVVRTDATGNIVTVARSGSNTINGTTSVTIGSQYETLVISGVSSTAWVSSKIALPVDTSNAFVTDIIRTPGVDSFWYRKGGVLYGVKDSTGGGGGISGLTTNELVYGNSATTIASLPVATYPSLTELSYVKGVTSSIQTQMDLKAPLASPTIATPTFTTSAIVNNNTVDGAALMVSDANRSLGGTAQTTAVKILGSATPLNNLLHMDNNSATARAGFTLSNSSSADWANNHIGLLANGASFASNYYMTNIPSKTSDAGYAYLYAQGTQINGFGILTANADPIWFGTNNSAGAKFLSGTLNILTSQYIGSLSTAPTALLHIKAGTATASTAPLKLTSGVASQTVKEAGAINYDGSNITLSDATYAYTLSKTLTGSATLDFGNTTAQTSTDLTMTLTGASDGDMLMLGTPNGSVSASDNVVYFAWVSAANTVTIRFSNNNVAAAVDPASGTFKISVIK